MCNFCGHPPTHHQVRQAPFPCRRKATRDQPPGAHYRVCDWRGPDGKGGVVPTVHAAGRGEDWTVKPPCPRTAMRSHNSLPLVVVAVLALASAMGVAVASRDVHTFTAAEFNSEPRGAASASAGEATAHADSLPPIALPPLWPQPFHSTRNAGFSVVHGPDGPGSCPVDLIPNTLNQATYRHTGVLSLDNQRLYVGRYVCICRACVLHSVRTYTHSPRVC